MKDLIDKNRLEARQIEDLYKEDEDETLNTGNRGLRCLLYGCLLLLAAFLLTGFFIRIPDYARLPVIVEKLEPAGEEENRLAGNRGIPDSGRVIATLFLAGDAVIPVKELWLEVLPGRKTRGTLLEAAGNQDNRGSTLRIMLYDTPPGLLPGGHRTEAAIVYKKDSKSFFAYVF